jgi:hypothetical protein
MSGPLLIPQGPPSTWWLSPAIWVTEAAPPYTVVANPIAGKNYNVQVQVENPFPEPVTGQWNLFVCWTVPMTGGVPLTYSSAPPSVLQSKNILNGLLAGGFWQGLPITVTVPAGAGLSAPGSVTIQAATVWVPEYDNGGHECLIAFAYLESATGLPVTTLHGNAPWTQTYTIAQHNLGVLAVGSHMRPRFRYRFQVCNDADVEHGFDIVARLAPLSEVARYLAGVPGGRSVLDKPGKVEHLGIVASGGPDQAELSAAHPTLASVKIPPRSPRAFTLAGSLPEGNALIHVTQSLDGRVVGGLSVLVMADAK